MIWHVYEESVYLIIAGKKPYLSYWKFNENDEITLKKRKNKKDTEVYCLTSVIEKDIIMGADLDYIYVWAL